MFPKQNDECLFIRESTDLHREETPGAVTWGAAWGVRGLLTCSWSWTPKWTLITSRVGQPEVRGKKKKCVSEIDEGGREGKKRKCEDDFFFFLFCDFSFAIVALSGADYWSGR